MNPLHLTVNQVVSTEAFVGALELTGILVFLLLLGVFGLTLTQLFRQAKVGHPLSLNRIWVMTGLILISGGLMLSHQHQLHQPNRSVIIHSEQWGLRQQEGVYYTLEDGSWQSINVSNAVFKTTPELANSLTQTVKTVDYWVCQNPTLWRYAGCPIEVSQVVEFKPNGTSPGA